MYNKVSKSEGCDYLKILVDETKLNLLLEKKKQFIGNRVVWDSVLSAISFLVSVFLATYKDIWIIPGTVLKTVFVLLGLFFSGKSVYDVYLSRKNTYTHEDLFNDINKLNEITHNHSIIAIKDSFNEFPNRFLLYDDNRWSCRLFLNFKDNINNESFIIDGISNRLKIKRNQISVKFIAQQIHEKYSESHKENRVYCHRLFEVSISQVSEVMKADTFEIDGVKYRWMSIAEMEQDSHIMEINSDIVRFVKDNCN